VRRWRRYIVARAQRDGDTALSRAAQHGHADCVRLLLDGGADTDTANKVRQVGPRLGLVVWGSNSN
jgi:ankyrin repeat protein